MTLRFTIPTKPRTKKTSNRIVSFGKPCYSCKRRPFQKIIPSEAFEQMEAECMAYAPIIGSKLRAGGVSLPIADEVSVRALFFRDADRGDVTGYMQALADVLQEPNQNRKGMGIIRDDRQIVGWDGTRLLKDSVRPRIEVEISVIEPAQAELLPL
jgi:hypothetical protein